MNVRLVPDPHESLEHLVEVVQKLSLATRLDEVVDLVRHAARELAGADGATFVLRDGNRCHYVDEDAIGPLWRGQRFPIDACISGWAMTHGEPVVLEDIYQDPRIPFDAYRPTFVKSLAMMPIRRENPIGAIGVYWARIRRATEGELRVLQALAHSTSVALTNVDLVRSLRESLDATRAAHDEVARQLRLRDDFIALAAHELRTPLTPLHFQLHRIERAASADAVPDAIASRVKNAVGIANRQLDDVGALAERMLDVSRIAMGRLELRLEESVSLAPILDETITRAATRGGATIETRVERELRARVDPMRLAQAVDALVQNAIKFGEGRPIEVVALAEGEDVCIRVTDHGVGIDPEAMPTLFDRFSRESSPLHFRGLGLGLFVCRGIVEAHGGTITVASRPGEGATFTIALPRAGIG